MIHSRICKALLAVSISALVVAAFVALRLESRPVFLPLLTERCKVVSVERLSPASAGVAGNQRIKEWGRRQLDKMGFHLIGSRGYRLKFPLDPREDSHLIAALCQATFPVNQTSLKRLETDVARLLAECIDDENSVPLKPVACLPANPGHVWFIWKYSDAEVFKPFPTSSSSLSTAGFLPTHLILMPKTGVKEILMLPVTD